MNDIGLYIHIPFCIRKCPYCDFYSLQDSSGGLPRYISAVKKHIEKEPYRYDSVFFGGGTPSLMSPDEFRSIFSSLSGRLSTDAEITAEFNPGDVSYDYFKALSGTPLNRVSIGVQSLNDSSLKFLGRRHTASDAAAAVRAAKTAGFTNISVDFMLGLPRQTEKDISDMLSFVREYSIQHISAYILKVEEGTPFYIRGIGQQIDDDEVSDLYLAFSAGAKELGFSHYEISNFALEGAESRHNLKYWNCEEYLGIGPSAHSFLGGKRFFTEPDTRKYIENIESGVSPFSDESSGGDEKERAMLALRLGKGLVISTLSEKLQAQIKDKVPVYSSLGLASLEKNTLALSEKGFLLSNTIISDLIF